MSDEISDRVTIDNEINADTFQDEIVSMIEELESGSEPLLLRIITGKVNPEETEKWAEDNNIPFDQLNDVLSVLTMSYETGTELAKKIENDIFDQNKEIVELMSDVNSIENNSEKAIILNKLNGIIDMLDEIRIQVDDLILRLN